MSSLNSKSLLDAFSGSSKSSFNIEQKNTDDQISKSDTIKGICIMVVSCVAIGMMGFSAKLIYQHFEGLKAFDLLLFRSFVMIPTAYIQAKGLRVNFLDIQKKNISVLFMRCFFGVIAQTTLFMSFSYLPASVSFMIFNVNPVFVMILAYFLLGENLTITKGICCLGAFLGILTVGIGRNKHESEGQDIQTFGIILCVASSLFVSMAYCMIRKLNKEVHFIFSPYYLSYATLIVCILAYLFGEDQVNPSLYTTKVVIICCLAAIFPITHQILLSLAYRYCNASTLSPILYASVVLNIFTDTLYFHYEFYWTDLIGGLLTIICVLAPVVLIIIKKEA
ncbi:unnamed protein product [Moneuplotes crassus]|uniref:EamA domain-containing protein n=1 Tax=Euplotes crassus TaxID=5936 RepID=A0AAD1XMY6_EUPCR|nr:unnamed protein product [Moneuplotes crassus]